MADPILVTGATGKTGREVVAQLGDRPHRAASRATGFDWHDPSGWAAVAEGTSAVYLVRPDLADAPELVGAFLDATRFDHVVLLSNLGAESPADSWAARTERAVTDRAASWTILRPSWFMQVLSDPEFFAGAIRAGELAFPSGGAALSWVDARDIAAVAVAALTAPAEHAGATYAVTGPEAVTIDAVAAKLGVRAGDPPIAEAAADDDPWLVELNTYAFGQVADGTQAAVSGDVERVLGRPPRTLDAFVSEQRDAWRPDR